jgi:hypothetical protein
VLPRLRTPALTQPLRRGRVEKRFSGSEVVEVKTESRKEGGVAA